MNIKNEVLEKYPFLKDLDKSILDEMFKVLILNYYEIGSSIFNNRQSCIGFSLILSGQIRVYKIGDDGKEITLYRLRTGDNCFNTVLCALTDADGSSFSEVEENALVAVIPMNFFKLYILNNTEFLKYIFRNLYNKFENVVGGLEKVTFDSIEHRLINYFKEKVSENNGSKIVYVTHEKIAADIGTSREVVSRKLKDLEKREYLELGRGKIKVKKL
jgi:CRP/FNR family transcriptional regulator, anaerobic regulatory protein